MEGSRRSKHTPPWFDLQWWMVVATAVVLAANTAVGTLAVASSLGIWVLHSAA